VGDTPDLDAVPGSWEHFIAIAPPYMILLATYQPEILAESYWVIG
jgi:hypothetical protein